MLIHYTDPHGQVHAVNLAGIFAALSRDEVVGFPALRAHQAHPFHAFLCQVGALALLGAGRVDLPPDAETWQSLLLGLTPEHPDGAAWQLVGEDWCKPALLQSAMDPALRASDKRAETPDALDMLLTARNHDLKGARMADAQEDDWFFALLSLQTQEGQMGAGNYGVSRMNGGYGARVGLGLHAAGASPGGWFARDVAMLIARREEYAANCGAQGSLALVWCAPWDGKTSLPFAQLDPLYIEICRFVRLARDATGRIFAVLANSEAPRIEAKTLKGQTGDPWAPVRRGNDPKSWGVSAEGFGYRQLCELLDPAKVELPLLAQVTTGTGDMVLHARAVTRGQGKTEGYHEREVQVPEKARPFFNSDKRATLAELANARREAAAEALGILRHALRVLLQGGPEQARADDDVSNNRVLSYTQALDHAVDTCFFDAAFWAALDGAVEERPARLKLWREHLRMLARAVLEQAFLAAPGRELTRIRAQARALNLFEARMARFIEPDQESRIRKTTKASA